MALHPSISLQAFNADLFAENWTAVAVSAVVAVVAIGAMFGASRILSSRRQSELKLTSYECGIPAAKYIWSNINVRFYIFAILFLIFDVEAVFLFPWAISLGKIGVFGFWSMMIFLGILTIGFIYEWKQGALEWE